MGDTITTSLINDRTEAQEGKWLAHGYTSSKCLSRIQSWQAGCNVYVPNFQSTASPVEAGTELQM